MAINERGYFGFKRTRGDASRVDDNSKGVPGLIVPTSDRDLHFAEAADEATDWNVSNPTHPTLYIHSSTTPATDYVALYHDATNGYLNVASGNLALQIDASTILTIASTGASLGAGNLTLADDLLLGLGTGNTARLSWDTTDANANALLLQMPAGGAVDVPVIAIGQSIESVDLGLYNGVVDPRLAMFGVGAVTTGPVMEFRKARGTIAAPTVVTTGDDLGTLDFYGAVANGEYVRAASIRADMSGTIATTRGPGNLSFNVATDAPPSVMTERLLITASGQINLTPATDLTVADTTGVIIGHTAQITAGAASELQVLGTALADASAILAMFSADAVGPDLQFVKSRNAALAGNTTVNDNDVVGRLVWLPADGTDLATEAAVLQAEVDDGSPAAGDIGMALVWRSMPGAAGAIREVMRVSAAGDLTLLGGRVIQANSSTEIGISVANATMVVGSAGSLQIPYVDSTDAAFTDAIGGDQNGCIGIQRDSDTGPTVTLEGRANGAWVSVALTGTLFPAQREYDPKQGTKYLVHPKQVFEQDGKTWVDESMCAQCGKPIEMGQNGVFFTNAMRSNGDAHAIYSHLSCGFKAALDDVDFKAWLAKELAGKKH